MPVNTLVKNPIQVKLGPGIIGYAPLGTAMPTIAAAASKFTMSFVGFRSIGYTDEGATFTFSRASENVEVAEELYPIKKVGTEAGCALGFSASGTNEGVISTAMAGGIWTTVSGTGATQVRKFSPPSPTSQVRNMWFWLGADQDELLVIYQGYQSGEITRNQRKGAEKASWSGFNIEAEVPDTAVSLDVWNYWTAGTWAAEATAFV